MQLAVWQSALIAALTAAVVTLAVEFAAKPTLEARKCRILDEDKAYREIQAGLKRIFISMGMLTNGQLVELAPNRVEEELLQLRGVIQHVQSQMAFIRLGKIPSNAMSILTQCLGMLDAKCILGLAVLSKDPTPEEFLAAVTMPDRETEMLSTVTDFLLTPRSHFRSWWHLRSAVNHAYSELADRDSEALDATT